MGSSRNFSAVRVTCCTLIPRPFCCWTHPVRIWSPSHRADSATRSVTGGACQLTTQRRRARWPETYGGDRGDSGGFGLVVSVALVLRGADAVSANARHETSSNSPQPDSGLERRPSGARYTDLRSVVDAPRAGRRYTHDNDRETRVRATTDRDASGLLTTRTPPPCRAIDRLSTSRRLPRRTPRCPARRMDAAAWSVQSSGPSTLLNHRLRSRVAIQCAVPVRVAVCRRDRRPGPRVRWCTRSIARRTAGSSIAVRLCR